MMMSILIVTYDSNKTLMRKEVCLYISALDAVEYIVSLSDALKVFDTECRHCKHRGTWILFWPLIPHMSVLGVPAACRESFRVFT